MFSRSSYSANSPDRLQETEKGCKRFSVVFNFLPKPYFLFPSVMPHNLVPYIELLLSQHTGEAVRIKKTQPVSGGCVSNALAVHTPQGVFFAKYNDAQRYPEMFRLEAKGLQLIAETESVNTPTVICCGESQGVSVILLEFIRSSAQGKFFWENFGKALARMHRNTATHFGLSYDNYIGSLHQSNNQQNNWISFFIHERLEKQVQLALKKSLLNTAHARQFEQLCKRLPQLLPAEQPALLHGDLWSGNFLTGADGEAVLIDPAVYYGHREAELAFTRLFGGFDIRFYKAYQAEFPLQPGFENRKDIYNLYPVLVHVNLFGASYVQSVEGILKKY